jgi:hypothetical protein
LVGEQPIDFLSVLDHAPHQRDRVLVDRCQLRRCHPLGEQRKWVQPAQVGFEKDVDSAFAGFAAGAHVSY